jgi:uroporphyrin-III C-methyltransferase/precorrin-2 dehydrogenase/sirohydrochlorin ferrochelatase
VNKAILELARRDAERIYVGKEQDNHAVPQDKINQMLADYALKGHRVLRLKGGDPFVFGRGGEEIDTLMQQGVSFQVVPGITAASGCAAYAGIPLTHRDYAQSVVFVTGHLKDGSMNINWPNLANKNQTIVFYMGLKALPIICKKLIEFGMASETPVALIQQGTTVKQKVYTGSLASMEKFDKQNVKPPTLIIIGDVVKLRRKLDWFMPDTSQDFQVSTPKNN